MAGSSGCQRCGHATEDFLHCVRDCPKSREIWQRMQLSNFGFFSAGSSTEWLRMGCTGLDAPRFLATLWHTWRKRNDESIAKEAMDSFKVHREIL